MYHAKRPSNVGKFRRCRKKQIIDLCWQTKISFESLCDFVQGSLPTMIWHEHRVKSDWENIVLGRKVKIKVQRTQNNHIKKTSHCIHCNKWNEERCKFSIYVVCVGHSEITLSAYMNEVVKEENYKQSKCLV